MPLYRIRGTVSFQRKEGEGKETVAYENQTLDAEAEGKSPQKALSAMHAHLQRQGVSEALFADGPRFYTWYEHELGQGWQEVGNDG